MTTLQWDSVGDRYYENGVSRAVLYTEDGSGVVWNGLISVEESVGDDVEPIYFDGTKFNDLVTLGDFQATLKAFTYPDEFLPYEGVLQEQAGFYISNQPKSRFGLSYRTLIGNDVGGPAQDYKLHLLYNLTAIPSDREYKTLSLDVDPIEFEWTVSAIPEFLDNYRPTSHVIFDSRTIDQHLLSDIEDILYGDGVSEPHLPSLKALASFVRKWNRLIITDNGDGTWTATANEEGIITDFGDGTFEITSDTAHFIDDESYSISSSNKNDEDV